MDLCQENCTWADSMTIDLYPWDAGTDSGISYFVRPHRECVFEYNSSDHIDVYSNNFLFHIYSGLNLFL